MQQLQRSVAVFCTACICAELVSLLAGSARTRKCIKAAAGLYILVSLIHALPTLHAQADLFSLPSVPAANFGSAEQAILQRAEQELEQSLSRQLLSETGWSVELNVILMQTVDGVQAVQVTAFLPSDCPDELQTQIQDLINRELQIQKVQFVQEEAGG